jgi:hypothetical protein
MRWALLALLVLLSQLVAVCPALADGPPHVRIEFAAPKARDCQREEIFRAMLRGLLRAPLLDPPAERVLSVRIDPRPAGGYHLRLAVSTLDGALLDEQELDYPPLCCFAVVYYAAFNAAVMINPPRPPASPPPPPAPCPSCEVCAAPPTPASPPPSPPRPAPKVSPTLAPPKPLERPWRAVLGLLYGANVSPSNAPGAQLGVQFRRSRFSAELDARYTFGTSTAIKGDALDTYTLAGVLAPCFRLDPLAVCGVVAGGILGAKLQVPNSHTDAALFLSVGGRLTLEAPLPVRFPWPLAVRLDAEAAGTAIPPNVRSYWDSAYGSRRALTWHGGASIVATF